MKSQKEALIDLLNEANDLGHNAEQTFDRELFAEWLISHGVKVAVEEG